MPTLSCTIPKEAWVNERGGRHRAFARQADSAAEDAGPWEASVQKIVQMQHLGDDWDGLGALAPTRELLESAVRLAYVLCEKGVEPPQSVVAGLDGSVNFEWQDADGNYAEVEIVRPFFAEVMVLEPGRPAKHWTLPTE
jgi:hypothetical protein